MMQHALPSSFLLAAALLVPAVPVLAAPAKTVTYDGYYVNPNTMPPSGKPSCAQSMQQDQGAGQLRNSSGANMDSVSSPCSLSNGGIEVDQFKNDGTGPGLVEGSGDDAAYQRRLPTDSAQSGVRRLPDIDSTASSVGSRPLAPSNGPAFSSNRDSFNAALQIQPFEPAGWIGGAASAGNAGNQLLAAASMGNMSGLDTGGAGSGLFGNNVLPTNTDTPATPATPTTPTVPGNDTGTPTTPTTPAIPATDTGTPTTPVIPGTPVLNPDPATPVDTVIPAVPEASTWAMLLAGLAIISLALRRRA